MYRSIKIVAALALLIPTTAAAERRARLTVDVAIEGSENVVGNGSDRAGGKFREGYKLVTYLQSDGELVPFNTKDPHYAQKMMGMSQGVNQRVRQAQGKPAAKKMTPEEMQVYLQKKQAACGTDQACMVNLTTEALELRLAMDSGKGAAAPAYTGDEPPRYMTYLGYDNCGASAQVYVDRTIQGTFGDTTGAMPYTIHDTADYKSTPDELRLFCNTHQVVLDTHDGSLYMDGAIVPTAKGRSTRTARGKTTTSEGEAAMHGEAYAWIRDHFRHVPREGIQTATLKLTQNQGASLHSGTYSGEARVRLAWKFEDVK